MVKSDSVRVGEVRFRYARTKVRIRVNARVCTLSFNNTCVRASGLGGTQVRSYLEKLPCWNILLIRLGNDAKNS